MPTPHTSGMAVDHGQSGIDNTGIVRLAKQLQGDGFIFRQFRCADRVAVARAEAIAKLAAVPLLGARLENRKGFRNVLDDAIACDQSTAPGTHRLNVSNSSMLTLPHDGTI